jgi:hypothetical protein
MWNGLGSRHFGRFRRAAAAGAMDVGKSKVEAFTCTYAYIQVNENEEQG